MSEESNLYEQQIKDRYIWDFLGKECLEKDVLENTVKFHQASAQVPSQNLYNYNRPDELMQWLDAVQNTDILPRCIDNEVILGKEKRNWIGSVRQYDRNWQITEDELGKILGGAFARGGETKSKRYGSAGALYPVLPLLLVFDNQSVRGLPTPGCYLFDSTDIRLLRLKKWTDDEVAEFTSMVNFNGENLPEMAMAYALDMRRALTKYGFRGYRHGLIEVGAMVQCLRESLREQEAHLGDYGDCSWSGFPDNYVTHACGLNVRLAPIVLIQCFGKVLRE